MADTTSCVITLTQLPNVSWTWTNLVRRACDPPVLRAGDGDSGIIHRPEAKI